MLLPTSADFTKYTVEPNKVTRSISFIKSVKKRLFLPYAFLIFKLFNRPGTKENNYCCNVQGYIYTLVQPPFPMYSITLLKSLSLKPRRAHLIPENGIKMLGSCQLSTPTITIRAEHFRYIQAPFSLRKEPSQIQPQNQESKPREKRLVTVPIWSNVKTTFK